MRVRVGLKLHGATAPDKRCYEGEAAFEPPAKRVSMHDLIIAVIFFFMLIGPCMVTLGGGKD